MNEIAVTRAPRLKGVTWALVPEYSLAADLSDGKVYSKIGTGVAVLAGKQAIGSNCHQMPSAVRWHPFDSFDAMCRWVANGRKLEDLSGDAKSEWTTASVLKLGCFATATSKVVSMLINEGDVLKRSENHVVNITQGNFYALDLTDVADMMVWPLGPGDSITISPRNP